MRCRTFTFGRWWHSRLSQAPPTVKRVAALWNLGHGLWAYSLRRTGIVNVNVEPTPSREATQSIPIVSPGRVWLKAVYPLVNTPPPESKALMGAAH